jgi:hypothetical protein
MQVNDNNAEHLLLLSVGLYFTISIWTVSFICSLYMGFYMLLCVFIAVQFQKSHHVTGGVIVGTILAPLVSSAFLYTADTLTQEHYFYLILSCVTSMGVCMTTIIDDEKNILALFAIGTAQLLALLGIHVPIPKALFALLVFYYVYYGLLRQSFLAASFSLGEAVITAQLITGLFVRSLHLILFDKVRR